jgi:hypothetical protein
MPDPCCLVGQTFRSDARAFRHGLQALRCQGLKPNSSGPGCLGFAGRGKNQKVSFRGRGLPEESAFFLGLAKKQIPRFARDDIKLLFYAACKAETYNPSTENPQLISQRKAVRHLLRVGLVKRLAKFAAIDFRVFPDPGLYFLWIVVPALEMPGAKFSLGILLIAGALPGFAHLDFLFRGRSLGRGRSGRSSRGGRSCGWRRGRCCR